jgi:hypothetical protein
MTIWRKIRIGIFIFTFVSSLLAAIFKPPEKIVGLGWFEVGLVFCFTLIAIPLLIGIQSKAPYVNEIWSPPTLDTNFLAFGDPLHFFHLASIVLLIGGISVITGSLFEGDIQRLEGVMQISAGLGALFGVKICEKLCSFKYR